MKINGKNGPKLKEWIQSIADGIVPDALSQAAEEVGGVGSVGTLQARTEYVLDTNREVPVFAFRQLGPADGLSAAQFAHFALEAEEEVIRLHKAHANARVRKRKSQGNMVSPLHRRASNCNICPESCSSQKTELKRRDVFKPKRIYKRKAACKKKDKKCNDPLEVFLSNKCQKCPEGQEPALPLKTTCQCKDKTQKVVGGKCVLDPDACKPDEIKGKTGCEKCVDKIPNPEKTECIEDPNKTCKPNEIKDGTGCKDCGEQIPSPDKKSCVDDPKKKCGGPDFKINDKGDCELDCKDKFPSLDKKKCLTKAEADKEKENDKNKKRKRKGFCLVFMGMAGAAGAFDLKSDGAKDAMSAETDIWPDDVPSPGDIEFGNMNIELPDAIADGTQKALEDQYKNDPHVQSFNFLNALFDVEDQFLSAGDPANDPQPTDDTQPADTEQTDDGGDDDGGDNTISGDDNLDNIAPGKLRLAKRQGIASLFRVVPRIIGSIVQGAGRAIAPAARTVGEALKEIVKSKEFRNCLLALAVEIGGLAILHGKSGL